MDSSVKLTSVDFASSPNPNEKEKEVFDEESDFGVISDEDVHENPEAAADLLEEEEAREELSDFEWISNEAVDAIPEAGAEQEEVVKKRMRQRKAIINTLVCAAFLLGGLILGIPIIIGLTVALRPH